MEKFKITDVRARQVFDCRWIPTIEVEIEVDDRYVGSGIAPIGCSTGSDEACELRDGEKEFYGKGCLKAIKNVETEIKDCIMGMDVTNQRAIDYAIINLDGTDNKSRLGANAIVATSLACVFAGAKAVGFPVYKYLNNNAHIIPVPLLGMIGGGYITGFTANEIQEFNAFPIGAESYAHAMQMGHEVHYTLGNILAEKYGHLASLVNVGGGYCIPCKSADEIICYILEAIDRCGYTDKIKLGFDCAATHWYDKKTKLYSFENKKLTTDELLEVYKDLVKKYPIVSLEDPFDENDIDGFVKITKVLDIQIIGDDFFVTNPKIIKEKMAYGAANAMLWKFNQVGTITEAFDAAQIAFRNNYGVMVSERSGENEGSALADLVVALNAGQVKTGSGHRSDRVAKHNRLLRIEAELGDEAVYAGEQFKNGFMQ